MKALFTCFAGLISAQTVSADVLVPVRTIRAQEIIGAEDIVMKPDAMPGALSDPSEIVGQEARIVLYPGRPVRKADIRPPAVVDRNETVTLVFSRNGLRILTEGRALGRGAPGETVRAMNLSSRTTVVGRIRSDGSIEVE